MLAAIFLSEYAQRCTATLNYPVTRKRYSGQRNVDVCQMLNDAIKAFVLAEKISPGMFLFLATRTVSHFLPVSWPKKANHRGIGGLHVLVRFRITHLRSVPVIEDLIRFWAGIPRTGSLAGIQKFQRTLRCAELGFTRRPRILFGKSRPSG